MAEVPIAPSPGVGMTTDYAEPVTDQECPDCPGDGSTWVDWQDCRCGGSGRVPLRLYPIGEVHE